MHKSGGSPVKPLFSVQEQIAKCQLAMEGSVLENTALVIIQWHMSAISEGLHVNRGDPRSSLCLLICQKQLPGKEKSLMKKRGWNCDR